MSGNCVYDDVERDAQAYERVHGWPRQTDLEARADEHEPHPIARRSDA